jgi:hypothetical protein
MIFSPHWEFSRWEKLQSRCHKLSSVIAETLPFGVNLLRQNLKTITKMDARVSRRIKMARIGYYHGSL